MHSNLPSCSDDRQRRLTLVFSLALAIYSCAAIGFYLFAEFKSVLLAVPDDMFYFLKTAQNIASGQGMTFDGINPTNGFQPLWLYLLTPLFSVYSGEPETMTRLVLTLQVLLLAGSGWLMIKELRKSLLPEAVLIFGLAFVFLVLAPGSIGMESPVLIGSLALLYVWSLRARVFESNKIIAPLVAGMLLGFVFLARLDHVFLAIVVFAAGGVQFLISPNQRRELFFRYLYMTIGFLAVISPYLVYNHTHFGGIMPMSGKLKSSFPHVSISPKTLGKLGVVKSGIAFAALCYVIQYFRTRKIIIADGRRYLRGSLVFLGAAVMIHYAHTLLYMQWGVFGWHFIAYNFLLCGLIAVAVDAWYERISSMLRTKLLWAAVAFVLIGGTAWTVLTSFNHDYNAASYDAAVWARNNTKPETIFAQKDTGTFGYFSQRRTINLDGLVNNMDYQNALRDGRLRNYFESHHVDYLIYHAFSTYPKIENEYDDFQLAYWSWQYKVFSDTISFSRQDEVFRTDIYNDGATSRPYLLCVWDLKKALDK